MPSISKTVAYEGGTTGTETTSACCLSVASSLGLMRSWKNEHHPHICTVKMITPTAARAPAILRKIIMELSILMDVLLIGYVKGREGVIKDAAGKTNRERG